MWDQRLTLKEIANAAEVYARTQQEKLDLLNIVTDKSDYVNYYKELEAALHKRRLFEDDCGMAEALLERLPDFAGLTLEEIAARFVAVGIDSHVIGGRKIHGDVPWSEALEWLCEHLLRYVDITTRGKAKSATPDTRKTVERVKDLVDEVHKIRERHPERDILTCAGQVLRKRFPGGKRNYTAKQLAHAYSSYKHATGGLK